MKSTIIFLLYVCVCVLGTVNYTWRGPQAASREPQGASGGAGGTGETDYGGLGAPIDGQMNQQGPLSFIHSPSGPLHRSWTWGLLTLGQDCIIQRLFLCRTFCWNNCSNRACETHKVKNLMCLNSLTLTDEAQVGQSQQVWTVNHGFEKNHVYVCVRHISPITYYCIVLMRCVCVCVQGW